MSNTSAASTSSSKALWALGLLIYACYVIGTLFPDAWWGTHFAAFLPAGLKWILLIAGAALLALPWWLKSQNQALSLPPFVAANPHLTHGLITIGMGILFSTLPIAADNYGDAYKFREHLEQVPTSIPPAAMESLLALGFSPEHGEKTLAAMVNVVAAKGTMSIGQAFHFLDVVFGCLFVFSWLTFLRRFLVNHRWRLLLAVAGLTAPFLAQFYGHTEYYMFTYLWVLWMAMLTALYYKEQKAKFLWWQIPVMLLFLKSHPLSLLFLPMVGLTFLYHYGSEKVRSWFRWKTIFLALILPAFIGGILVYIFVLEDHKDERHLQTVAMAWDRLFLPFFSPAPPLDNYNLFSPAHLTDYVQSWFNWSGAFLFLGLGWAILKRKQINWQSPGILLLGMTFIFVMGLFFMANPLLSMPMDADLFALPAPLFMVLVVILIQPKEEEGPKRAVTGATLAFSLLGLAVIMVNSDREAISYRYESIARHVYGSYYEWTSDQVEFVYKCTELEGQAFHDRKRQLINTLEPQAIPGNDLEFSRLLMFEGKDWLRRDGQLDSAAHYLQRAYNYGGRDNNLALYWLELHFRAGDFEQAYVNAEELLRLQHPTLPKAQRIYIHLCLETDRYQEAFTIAQAYLKLEPNDVTIQTVLQRLQANDDVTNLKFLFNRS